MRAHNSIKINILLLFILGALFVHAKEVSYRDFGAKGDGKTNDYEAIKKAHDYANKKGFPVRANDKATYYIGDVSATIKIKTNTNFGSATFIIDDRNIKNFRNHVFVVQSSYKHIKIENITKLLKRDSRIRTKLKRESVVVITNDKVKRFVRYGANKNAGSAQTDTLLVDRKGRIDRSAPLIWDFRHISKMIAYPIDKKILKIKGGKFITIAHSKKHSSYVFRGIGITRSNVIVEGLEHHIKGEGKQGAPYKGFLSISKCANITLRDVALSGRRFYYKLGNSGRKVAMGTYGLFMSHAVKVFCINCKQVNSIMDRKLWGIMGTNFCKDIVLDGCNLSRFDAHQGVMNVTIRNSTLGYMGIQLTGFGKFLAENTTVKANNFINLRKDYGSTWNGEIKIINCRILPQNNREIAVITGRNTGQHNFGYRTYLGQKIIIDKLVIKDGKQKKRYKGPVIFGDFNPQMINKSYKPPYPQVLPKLIAYRGIKTEKGKSVRLSKNTFMFKGVKLLKNRK